MFKLSKLISKPVFSVYEGLFVGTIINVRINTKLKTIVGVFVLSADEDVVNFVSKNSFYKLGENALLISNTSKLQEKTLEENNLIGKEALTIYGENVGQVSDVIFNEKFKLINVVTSRNVVVPFNNIINIGSDAIFFGEKAVKISALKPKVKKLNTASLNSVVSITNSVLETGNKFQVLANSQIKGAKFELPVKIVQNPSFLIGRTAKFPIRLEDGEYIIKEGQKISEKTISKAQINNKLYELSSCAN